MMALVFILAVVLVLAISWGVTTGAIWLICKLVGWTFSWKIAMAIWIGIVAVKFLFDKGSKD